VRGRKTILLIGAMKLFFPFSIIKERGEGRTQKKLWRKGSFTIFSGFWGRERRNDWEPLAHREKKCLLPEPWSGGEGKRVTGEGNGEKKGDSGTDCFELLLLP